MTEKKIRYLKESIIEYLAWIFHDALSWKAVDRFKVDSINKRQICYFWTGCIFIIDLLVFCYLLLGTNILHSNTLIFILLSVLIILIYLAFLIQSNRMNKLELAMYIKSCQTIFQYPEFQSDKNHSAIILLHYENAETEEGIFDLPLLLIEGFRKNKIPYKVYHVFNPNDFESIFYNNLITDLWIIGHGDHGGFCYGKKRRDVDYYSYSKLKKMPPKKFIAQLHCNGGKGESLVSINHSDEGYVTTRIQMLTQIRYYIIIKMRELDEKSKKNSLSD